MALRFCLSRNCGSKLSSPILKVICKQNKFIRYKSSSAKKPSVPFIEDPSSIFSIQALNHHWGAWPVVITLFTGLAFEVLGFIYLGATRSDVWFTKSPAACEIIETRKGYKVPVRKFKTINQKWEYPPELLAAVQGDVDRPLVEDDKKKKSKK